MLTKELEEAKGALQEARKELAREKVQGAELAVRSQGVQRELAFRIQVQISPDSPSAPSGRCWRSSLSRRGEGPH